MRFVVALGLALVAALGMAQAAAACSCAPTSNGEKLRLSDGAVVARLVAVRPVDPVPQPGSSADATDFVYRTGKVVKGPRDLRRGGRLVVRSTRAGTSCGLSDEIGDLSGLFVFRRDGRWTSGSCVQIPARAMRRLGSGEGATARARCDAGQP